MFRSLLLLALMFVPAYADAAALIGGSDTQVVRGSVAALGECTEGSSFLTVGGTATTTLVYSPLSVTPQATTLSVGQRVFVLTSGKGSCGGSPTPIASFIFVHGARVPTSTPPSPPTDGGGSGGTQGGGSQGSNPLADQLKGLAQNLLGGSGPVTNVVNGVLRSALGVPVSSVAGGQIPFGGAIASQPIPCAFPPGAICVQVLTPPVPIPIICQPGVCMSFLNGPPAYVSQWLLGNTAPAPIACLDGTGEVICEGHPIGMLPGHGSSGPTPPPPPAPTGPPPTPGQCGSIPNTAQTPALKKQAEENVRKYLANCGVGGVQVTSTKTDGAPCGVRADGLKYGCTDVGAMQCGFVDEICELDKCAPVTIGGGSEYGHSGYGAAGMHGSGNAFDLNRSPKLDSCIETKFTKITCPKTLGGGNNCWRDPRTGTVYYKEDSAHWHVCTAKYCGS